MNVDREVPEITRRQIARLWDTGKDTAEIAMRLGMAEPQVLRVVEDHVTAKRHRRQTF